MKLLHPCFCTPLAALVLLADASSQTASPPREELIQLSEFEVKEKLAPDAYRATESISAAGIALPLSQLPVPVQVLTGSLLEERGVQDMLDALYLIPGASTDGPGIHGHQLFLMRGYPSPGMRNGLRLSNDSTDSAEIERIEVARGPTAVLYGSGATGGVINRITKKPRYQQQGSVTLGLGSYSYYRAAIDVTGPLPILMRDGRPTLAYRLIAQERYNETDIDWQESRKSSLNASLRWQPLERLTLSVEYARNQRDSILAVEIPVRNDPVLGQVYDRNPTGRGYHFSIMGPDAFNDLTGEILEVEATARLHEGLTLRAIFADHQSQFDGLRARDIEVWSAVGRARLEAEARDTHQQLGKAELLWDTRLWNASSKLLVGFERSQTRNQNRLQRANWFPPAGFAITPAVRGTVYATNPASRGDGKSQTSAYRINHFVSALDNRLHVLWGARLDRDIKSFNNLNRTPRIVGGDTTYQVGAVYDLTRAFGVFVNHSTDFLPNTALARDGSELDPQTGKGFDVGLKLHALDRRLTGSVSLFDARRQNIARRRDIPDNPATPDVDEKDSFFVLSGEEQARGIDFDLIYDVTPRWTVLLSGAFFNAETVANEQDRAQVGLPPQDTAERSMNLQTVYRFDSGVLKHWSLGFGGYWRDDYRVEGNANAINVRTDDHYILNAFGRRNFRAWGRNASFAINVDNLLDRRGYIKNQERFGEPLVVRGTLRLDF